MDENKRRRGLNIRGQLKLAPGYLVLATWVSFTFVVLFWVVGASLSTTGDIFRGTVFDFSTGLHFENYSRAWIGSNVSVYFANSLVYAVISCVLLIALCAPFAYVLVRHRFPGSRLLKTGLAAASGVPIIMVIIQQTMLIGIGMIGGTWREHGLYHKLCPAGRRHMSTLPIVLGRGLVYASLYAVTCFYILGLHYRLFHYPMNGATGTILLFMAVYMAACIGLSIAVSTLFRYRENSLLFLLWTSIPLLMLSGVSYPREGIPDWLFQFGQLFPSSHGVNAFIRIQTMGASLSEVFAEIKALVILAVIYGGLACIGTHLVIRREGGCACSAPEK